MSLRLPSSLPRASQGLHIRHTLPPPTRRFFLSRAQPQTSRRPPPTSSIDAFTNRRAIDASRAHHARLTRRYAFLTGFTILATFIVVSLIDLPTGGERLDAPPSSKSGGVVFDGTEKVIVTTKDAQGVEMVPTGTSTVPYFPKHIKLPTSVRIPGREEKKAMGLGKGKSAALPAGTGDEEEYDLLGLGIRTVSFLGIQVYVAGLYVARSDLGKLQERMIKAGAGEGASTLVSGEREALKQRLLDGDEEGVWESVLKDAGIRSALRIVPTRGTDFGHLRDGWIRGIEKRGKGAEFEDETFGISVGAFKGVFGGKGRVGRGKQLVMARGREGGLTAWVERDDGKSYWLGVVEDERVSRLVWLGYLGGKEVSSEGMRRSVVDGVMELVERPVGTVETQVV